MLCGLCRFALAWRCRWPTPATPLPSCPGVHALVVAPQSPPVGSSRFLALSLVSPSLHLRSLCKNSREAGSISLSPLVAALSPNLSFFPPDEARILLAALPLAHQPRVTLLLAFRLGSSASTHTLASEMYITSLPQTPKMAGNSGQKLYDVPS